MKKLPIFCLTAFLACLYPVCAQEARTCANPYDTLSRVLTPIASVFSPEAEQHALSLSVVLEEMTGMPPELAGARFELLVQPPERLLIRGIYDGKPVTVCRAGNFVWITPNEPPFTELANPPGEPVRHKKKKKGSANDGGLGPMVLPFPPQQLALLPILFQVRESPSDDRGMRALDVRLMPELAKSLGVEEWSARLALDAAGKPARLRLIGPGWAMAVEIDRLDVAASLPPETWRAPANALRLDAPQVEQWMRELSRRVDTYRPAPNR